MQMPEARNQLVQIPAWLIISVVISASLSLKDPWNIRSHAPCYPITTLIPSLSFHKCYRIIHVHCTSIPVYNKPPPMMKYAVPQLCSLGCLSSFPPYSHLCMECMATWCAIFKAHSCWYANDEEDAKQRKPVWVNEEEERINVNIAKVNRLGKLRKEEDESVIFGSLCVSRLRALHAKLKSGTEWA